MAVRVSAKIKNAVRRRVVIGMAREYIGNLGVSDCGAMNDVTLLMSKGLVDLVELIHYDQNGQQIGYNYFKIDWDKGEAIIQGKSGVSTFRIDLERPISEQVNPVLAESIAYYSRLRELHDVASTRAVFSWRSGISPKEINSAREKVGLSVVDGATKRALEEFRRRSDKIRSDSFAEVSYGGYFGGSIHAARL